MDEVNGGVHYADNRVTLTNLKGRHGGGVLALKAGQVLLRPGGGYQVRLANDNKEPPLLGRGLTPCIP